VPGHESFAPAVLGDMPEVVPAVPDESDEDAEAELASFGSSEYAKVILGGVWGKPPALDLQAEAELQKLLITLAVRGFLHSARDISDGGVAVALAQSTFENRIGAAVEQDVSMLVHPLFGLFAEPASTVIVTAAPDAFSDIAAIASEHNFFAVAIGATGGHHIQITVDREPFIAASLEDLRRPWANALEANLHGEVVS
jgi:phosphoribosylformylglycinamidine synthase